MFEKPFRLHFSSIFEEFIRGFWVVLVILVTNLTQGITQLEKPDFSASELLISVGVLFGIIILVLVILYLKWRKTYITLTEQTLIIQKLLINKRITTIGLKNISNVDFEQNLFEKILGTAKLKLDTNSLSTANQNDVKIILKLDKIKELKKNILLNIDNIAREDNTNLAGNKTSIDKESLINETNSEEDKFDVAYDFKRVFEHTLLSIPILSFIIMIGTVVFFVISLQNPDLSEQFLNNLFGPIFAIAVIVVPIIYSSLRNIFKLYNFKAKRINDKIHISYGLLTTRKYTIPIDMINAVIIKQPTLARLFKKYTVEIVNVGMVDDKNDVPVMLLLGDKKELKDNLKTLFPELDINVEEEKQPKRALIPITIQFFIWSLILVVPTLIFLDNYFVAKVLTLLGIFVFIVISIILAYKTRKLSIKGDSIYITKGIFLKSTVIIKIGKIQLLKVVNSALTKKLQIQKLKVHILAATAYLEHHSGYFKNEIVQKILKLYK